MLRLILFVTTALCLAGGIPLQAADPGTHYDRHDPYGVSSSSSAAGAKEDKVPRVLKRAREKAQRDDLVGAADDYQEYLEDHKDDGAVTRELDELKKRSHYAAQVLEREEVVAGRVRPKENMTAQFMVEFLTPVLMGLDVSVYAGRHHNWGIGGTYLSVGSDSVYTLHPRYRCYRAESFWDLFVEIGGTVASTESIWASKEQKVTRGWQGIDLGYGLNAFHFGNTTTEILVSLNFGEVTTTEWRGNGRGMLSKFSEVRSLAVIPLIGFGWGWVF